MSSTGSLGRTLSASVLCDLHWKQCAGWAWALQLGTSLDLIQSRAQPAAPRALALGTVL